MMKALVFDSELEFTKSHPQPEPPEGEALVRVLKAGVCNTDIEITSGYMDFRGVIGHEFIGVVEEAASPRLRGKRVVGEINCACSQCPECLAGMRTHCRKRTVLGIFGRDGAFAEYLTLPEENLHIVPPNVSDEEAIFIEPLAAAFEILQQIDVDPDVRVAVLGDGKLGLLVAQVLHLVQCDLVVIGKHREKLTILEELGIETAFARSAKSDNFDVVVECTGSPAGLAAATNLVRPRGSIVLKTTTAKTKKFNPNILVIDEITVIGSRCGPFAPALSALEKHRIQVKELISETFPLSNGLKAIETAGKKGAMKVILDIAST